MADFLQKIKDSSQTASLANSSAFKFISSYDEYEDSCSLKSHSSACYLFDVNTPNANDTKQLEDKLQEFLKQHSSQYPVLINNQNYNKAKHYKLLFVLLSKLCNFL